MRLRTRLVIGLVTAALVPLLLLGVAATEVATRTITQRVVDLHVQKATALGAFVDISMSSLARGLGLVTRSVKLENLSDEGRIHFERLVYNQFDDVNIVCLISPSGVDIAPSQFLRGGAEEWTQQGHELVNDDRFREFRANLPIAPALRDGISFGDPYLPKGARYPVVPIALAVSMPEPALLGVEVSLRMVALQLEAQATGETEVTLLDENGEFIIRMGQDLVRPLLFKALWGTPTADLKYAREDGEEVLAAFSEVGSTGWRVVVAEPFDIAKRPGRDIRYRSAYFCGIAACLAVLMGIWVSRQIHGPVERLRQAVLDIGAGRLGRTVELDPVPEFRDLERAFNEMSLSLKESRDKIEAQQDRIEAFNRDLQLRVDERTKELKEAQVQLLESGKLAAVAELGSGLAHELNNPLAGVLGLAQILAARQTEGTTGEMLAALEAQARRCSEIVQSLLHFTQESITRGEMDVVDLDSVMDEVVRLVGGAFKQRGVTLELRPSGRRLPIRADRAIVGRALTQLLTSLRSLAPEGSRLRIRGWRRAGQVEMQFEIDPVRKTASESGRDEWYASGMSLWVARKILAEHGGRLTEPDPGTPGRYLLVLPEAP